MTLVLNIYYRGELNKHVEFYLVSSVKAELLPFDCLNFNDFSILSHSLVTNGLNFMILLLNVYDKCVVIHVKFHHGAIS